MYAEVLTTLECDAEADSATRRADAVEADQNADVGASLLFRGDIKRARTLFERALAIDPDCLTAHWLLGDMGGARARTTARSRITGAVSR